MGFCRDLQAGMCALGSDGRKWIAIVAVALLLFGAGIVLGEEKTVSGTKHDVASPGVPACVYCHLPKDPGGEMPRAIDSDGGPLSGLKRLCFSCHDGTVTSVGVYVFNPSRTMHVRNGGVTGQDCDRCHDAHGTGYDKFLKMPGGASFCLSCHWGVGLAGGHPTDIDARAAGIQPADSDWDPTHGDFSGTRLWNLEGTGPGDYVKCLTCHTTHGGEPGTQFNTLPLGASDEPSSDLCLNCHFDRRSR